MWEGNSRNLSRREHSSGYILFGIMDFLDKSDILQLAHNNMLPATYLRVTPHLFRNCFHSHLPCRVAAAHYEYVVRIFEFL